MTQQTIDQAAGASIALPIAAATLLAGADPMGLVLGLIAAVTMTFALGGVDSKPKAFAGIIFAALLAGYGMPVVAAGILHQWPEWKPVMDLAHPLMSIAIGGASPSIIPAFLAGLARRADRIGGGDK